VSFDNGEYLFDLSADGDDQSALVGELIDEGPGYLGCAGGYDDALERSLFLPAYAAVADEVVDVGDAQGFEQVAGVGLQGLQSFDGVNVFSQFGQDGGLVARAGAYFQDAVLGLDFQFCGHRGHHVWLGYGLAMAYGEGLIAEGVDCLVCGDELLAGDFGHGLADALVGYSPAADLLVDHLPALGQVRIC